MTRWLDVFALLMATPSATSPWHVCDAAGFTYCTRRHALKIGGCGMDMGFADCLRTLAAGSGQLERLNRTAPVRNGEPDTAGGYALTALSGCEPPYGRLTSVGGFFMAWQD